MRSASSTCAGRPVDMRPATYLTSGENASTSCSRARGSSSSLYLHHSSRSSMDLTFVSRGFPLPYGRRCHFLRRIDSTRVYGGVIPPRGSGNVDGRPHGNLVVDVDHVRDGHADATVRGRGAERPDVGGAVDAGAVVDAEPARLQRVLRRSAWDDLPRHVTRPRRVRHVPGRVHRLVLHVVEAGRRLEPDLADGDRVGLDQLQLLV